LTAPATRPTWRSSFARQVYLIVRRIPRGRVSTYGSIAASIPAPAGIDPLAYRRIRARWVGYAMASAPEGIPWQRVVNALGRVSPRPGFGAAWQMGRLTREGIRFTRQGGIDLKKYGWAPRRPASDR
jgi:methylated-DNA-protein-cysteine methyltransferase-like protein